MTPEEVVAGFIASEVGFETPQMIEQAKDLIAELHSAGYRIVEARRGRLGMNQDGDLEGDIPESLARAILTAALDEERCSEFMVCLSNGGIATVDPVTGKLLLHVREISIEDKNEEIRRGWG